MSITRTKTRHVQERKISEIGGRREQKRTLKPKFNYNHCWDYSVKQNIRYAGGVGKGLNRCLWTRFVSLISWATWAKDTECRTLRLRSIERTKEMEKLENYRTFASYKSPAANGARPIVVFYNKSGQIPALNNASKWSFFAPFSGVKAALQNTVLGRSILTEEVIMLSFHLSTPLDALFQSCWSVKNWNDHTLSPYFGTAFRSCHAEDFSIFFSTLHQCVWRTNCLARIMGAPSSRRLPWGASGRKWLFFREAWKLLVRWQICDKLGRIFGGLEKCAFFFFFWWCRPIMS